MSDFGEFLNDLGHELFGKQWPMFRPYLEAWADKHPDRVRLLEDRLLAYVEARQ